MLTCIVGLSGTGKSYIVDKMSKELGTKEVLSRTERKPRYEGEATHLFVSKEQADKEYGDAIAYTVFDGNRYYTLKEDLVDKDFYIIDKAGLMSLCKNGILFRAIYLKVPFFTRIKRLIKRDGFFKAFKRMLNDYKMFKGAENMCDITLTPEKLYTLTKLERESI